jgi:uncharacterized protein
MSQNYQINVAIVTTEDAQGKDTQEYADDFYVDQGYYDNGAKGGTLYLIDLDNREIYMCNVGTMNRYITDSRLEDILDEGYTYVSEEEYYSCIQAMIRETYLWLEKGIPEGQYNYNEDTGAISRYRSITPMEAAIAFVVALAAALLTAVFVVGKYRLKIGLYKEQLQDRSRLKLTRKEDIFLSQTVTTRRIPRNPPPSSGGGRRGGGGGNRTTIHSTGGRSFGGGGRKF